MLRNDHGKYDAISAESDLGSLVTDPTVGALFHELPGCGINCALDRLPGPYQPGGAQEPAR